MHIVDWAKKGNVVRFYLGDTQDYWGDDWDDTPYEHNAGMVYEEYVRETVDVVFPFEYFVLEAGEDWSYNGNSPFSKEDFKNRIAPCLVAVTNLSPWEFEPSYSKYIGAKCGDVTTFYLGDDVSTLLGEDHPWQVLDRHVCDG